MDGSEVKHHPRRGVVAGPLLQLVAILADIARTAAAAESSERDAPRVRDRDRSRETDG